MSRFVCFLSAHAGARIPPPCCCYLPAACSDQIADPVTVIITSVCICAPIFSGSAALGPASIPYARLRCSCTQCHHTAPALSVVDTHRQRRKVCVRACVCDSSHAQLPESLNMHAMHVVCFSDASEGGWRSQPLRAITTTIPNNNNGDRAIFRMSGARGK